MAFKTWNTQADWDAAYNLSGETDGHPNTRPEVRLGYCRSIGFEQARLNAAAFVSLLTLTPTTPIVIIGAGFGWTAEVLSQSPYTMTSVISVDVSTWIQANKSLSETADISARIVAAGLDPLTGRGAELLARHADGGTRARVSILNEDLSSNASRNRVKQAIANQTPAWCVTEFMLESLTDAECQQASTRAHGFSGATKLAHLIDSQLPPGFNVKTLEQWKTLIPTDTFIDARGWRML